MRVKSKKGKLRRHPVSMFEAVMALCILFLLFFGLMQIAEWCVNTVFCQYSAFYAAKGMSLGYQNRITLRASRVASIGIAGPSVDAGRYTRASDYDRAKSYMLYGDASGVWYQFWGSIYNKGGPQIMLGRTLKTYPDLEDKAIEGKVYFKNPILLTNGLNFLLGIDRNPSPQARVTSVDNAIYLED